MGGVSVTRESDTSSTGLKQPREKGRTVSLIEINAATLASLIREQKALPITDGEAESFARALGASNGRLLLADCYQSRVAGSANCGEMLLAANRVSTAICAPARVSTKRPDRCPSSSPASRM